MWDIETIKHLNESLEGRSPKRMSKIWRYMEAWRKARKGNIRKIDAEKGRGTSLKDDKQIPRSPENESH